MPNFATPIEFLTAVRSHLGADNAVATALIGGIAVGEEGTRGDSQTSTGALNMRLGGWVLRDQDLPILEAIGITAAAVTAVIASGPALAGAVVTALSSFAALCWKTWRRGAPLSKTEIGVLGFLQVHGPLSEDDLVGKASAALGALKADIEGAMKTLQEVELRDGAMVSLIRKDAAGQWRVRAG